MIEFQNIQIIRNIAPISTLPIVSGSINVWVWGDTNINIVTASIKNGFVEYGYTASFTTQRLGNTFNGDIITGSTQPDVLVYWQNGGDYGGSNLVKNIRKYLNNGGGFVTSVFVPSINPINWDIKITPLSANGTQGYGNLGTGSLVSSSIILQGVDLALNQASSRNYYYESIPTPFTQSSAVIAARWPSINQPLLVQQISGSNSARLAYLNFYLPIGSANPTGSRRLLTRTLLWAAKQI